MLIRRVLASIDILQNPEKKFDSSLMLHWHTSRHCVVNNLSNFENWLHGDQSIADSSLEKLERNSSVHVSTDQSARQREDIKDFR